MELEGRVAVVLGGGGEDHALTGIGMAICLAFAREGARVVVVDASEAAARHTLAAIEIAGGRGEALACDVTDDDALTDLLQRVPERLGRLDILYANVGLGQAGSSAKTTPAQWRLFADANLTCLHVASQAVLPTMRSRGAGVILTTSSIAGIRDVGYAHLAYGATKAAAIHFMRLLACEEAAHGIRANAIVAGLIDTPRIERTLAKAYADDSGDASLDAMRASRARQCPLQRMGRADDVAEAALFLASDRAAYITGTELVVDGGLSATVRTAP